MSKKSLIIPDLHHKWLLAEKIIASVPHDEVIFLGDYFDDFFDTPLMARETAEWLKKSMSDPTRIHLMGNHDIHYAFSNSRFRCSGYTQEKYYAIHDILSYDFGDKLKFYHVLDNTWLLSHAGLHKAHVLPSILKLKNDRVAFFKELSDYLDREIVMGIRAASENARHWIFGAGAARWGSNPFGGIIWCDHNKEMSPTRGLFQIYGHTPQSKQTASWVIKTKNIKNKFYKNSDDLNSIIKNELTPEVSFNLCLDVWKCMHYAVWDGENLSIGKADELFSKKT